MVARLKKNFVKLSSDRKVPNDRKTLKENIYRKYLFGLFGHILGYIRGYIRGY